MSLAAYIKGTCSTLLPVGEDWTKYIEKWPKSKKVLQHIFVPGTENPLGHIPPHAKSPITSSKARDTVFPINLVFNHMLRLAGQLRAWNLAKD